MVVMKLLGAGLLVGGMAALAAVQARKVKVAIAIVQAWRAFLDGMRHEILTAGVALSAVIDRLRRDTALRMTLLGGRDVLCERDTARELLRRLCRGAATLLPSDAPAAVSLYTLDETFDEAISEGQIVQKLEALLAELETLEQSLQMHSRQECRIRSVLYICGALCTVLMLW